MTEPNAAPPGKKKLPVVGLVGREAGLSVACSCFGQRHHIHTSKYIRCNAAPLHLLPKGSVSGEGEGLRFGSGLGSGRLDRHARVKLTINDRQEFSRRPVLPDICARQYNSSKSITSYHGNFFDEKIRIHLAQLSGEIEDFSDKRLYRLSVIR